MKWTGETPTEKGCYWFKCAEFPTPMIVEVKVAPVWSVTHIGDDQPYRLPWDDEGQQWAGPLEAPQ